MGLMVARKSSIGHAVRMTVYGCRVPGCEWEGRDLDDHLMNAHGWTQDELVTLAGLKLYWEAT
jgi:hypothetical protein